MSMRRAGVWKPSWVLFLLLSVSGGCGGQAYPGPPRAAVSGKVTFDGAPIGIGSITFLPKAGNGPVSGGTITDGAFNLTEEFGPTIGEQTVQFQWRKPTGKKQVSVDGGQEFEETVEGLPEKYHSKSTETVTIKSGSNECNFSLTSK